MEDAAKLFDQACLEWGKARRYHPIPEFYKPLFETQRNEAQQWIDRQCRRVSTPFNVYFDYLDDGLINAVADVQDNTGFIGLNSGTLLVLADTFARALSHPSVLTSIGDSEQETLNQFHSEGLCDDWITIQANRLKSGLPPHPTLPQNELRRDTAQVLTMFAFQFILQHEIAHIFRGHCEYLKKKYNITFLCEAISGPRSAPAIYGITVQAAEFDADVAAAAESLLSISDLPWKEDFLWLVDSVEKRIFLWSFSVTIMFYLFGFRIDPKNLASGNHPPPALRFHMIQSAAVDACKDALGADSIDFAKPMEAGLMQASEAVDLIGGERLGPAIQKTWSGSEVRSHLSRVVDRWKTLMQELQPYARR